MSWMSTCVTFSDEPSFDDSVSGVMDAEEAMSLAAVSVSAAIGVDEDWAGREEENVRVGVAGCTEREWTDGAPCDLVTIDAVLMLDVYE